MVVLSIYPSRHPSIQVPHPGKKKMMEEEEEGGGRIAASVVYPNVFVIQSSSIKIMELELESQQFVIFEKL